MFPEHRKSELHTRPCGRASIKNGWELQHALVNWYSLGLHGSWCHGDTLKTVLNVSWHCQRKVFSPFLALLGWRCVSTEYNSPLRWELLPTETDCSLHGRTCRREGGLGQAKRRGCKMVFKKHRMQYNPWNSGLNSVFD